jgi:amidase
MLPVVIGAMASGRAEAETSLAVENASLADVQAALAGGKITASALARAYLARIEAYDRGGPGLNAVREVDPDALAIAGRLDGIKPSARQPLAGVPILVKDNIATGDKQWQTWTAAPSWRCWRRRPTHCARGAPQPAIRVTPGKAGPSP